MFEFDKLCKEIEEMDPQLFAEIFAAKSANVIAALSAITNDALDGMQLFLHFILCSIAADGKLAEEEYLLIKPAIEKVYQKQITYEDAVEVFKNAGLDKPREYKKAVDDMVNVLGMISLDLQAEVIGLCLMVCAVDGKISMKEKKWIKQLAR